MTTYSTQQEMQVEKVCTQERVTAKTILLVLTNNKRVDH